MKNLVEVWCKIYLEQKFKIEEMADSVQDIKKDIKQSREDLLTHLICYYVLSDITTNQHHWEKDIYNAFPELSKIKGKNKYPNKRQLWDWGFETTIEKIEDHLDVWITKTEIKENRKLPKNINYKNLQEFMKDYIMWLYEELSKPENEGKIQLDDTRKVLQDLYKQYHN